jgi:predicted phosphoadenosine phosphosulfate sulfurtransferase
MAKIRKKQSQEDDVYTAAIKRVNYLYDCYDDVIVSFSGGKDSTAVLNIVLEVARKRNKLPVHAVFFDEEAIHPTTIEYVERVRQNPEIKLDWYCLPVKHRNACSNDEPFWWCWDPAKKDLWVRPLPDNCITEHPKFVFGESFQEFFHKTVTGNKVVLNGIRTQESLRRYRVIASKKNDAFMGHTGTMASAYPIYDWSSEDVWRLVYEKGYDYNRTYDIFNKTRMYGDFLRQRVCPPYGEEPLRGLWVYAECFPEMWHKMLMRVPGVNTAWRYANTELYSNTSKPENLTWKDYMNLVIESYSELEYKNQVKANINKCIIAHYKKTKMAIHDDDPHPITGLSYKFLAQIAIKGDFKNRQQTKLLSLAIDKCTKLGITLEQAKQTYA